ncbi:phage portal protein [Streptomyces prunicolor]|uniref:phage portal protein n=1 Tax=Streptomyces prunicolor TaxID=67348 RepID=UPI0003762933|nr:phage head morphogenesis protein [Streptomyces prunicolor]
MGLRSTLAKVFANRVPAETQAAEAAAQMTPASPFSPGTPIGPYDGYSRTPRTHDFVTGYNISARPKSHERVSFETLKGLVDAYDVAQMCIWHRIDSIRALEWSLVPAPGFRGDAQAAIDLGMKVLEKPDRQTPFATWLAKWLYDVLAFDAGCLYRLRNRGGRAIGLRTVDGTTIAPLLDYWGNSPEDPAEAYVQYVNGLPWNWLTRSDLIYEPFRPRTSSPYGTAPLESILLNANTDLRFQQYFLQRFTDGNIPRAFASAPEGWTPEQIDQFQVQWDALMLGDQSIQSQIRWMPGGGKIEWSNEKEFSDAFSLFLMRKTCAAYHIVPSDLGFTESVNRSSGETQADVQHRVGDLPLISYIQGALSYFLRHDLELPLQFAFDTGQEQEDRLELAQAWQVYIDTGMASPDEGREKLLGLPGDPHRPTPRFYSTSRLGPVPLLSIQGVAGRIDPETFGPAEDQPALPQPFVAAPATVPAPGTADAAAARAAEDAYQTQARQIAQGPAQLAKDAGAPAPGITAGTGLTGYDLVGRNKNHDEEEGQEGCEDVADRPEDLLKRELAAFRRFRQARRRNRVWRDFEFRTVGPVQAHRLNDAGRLAVRKDAGEIAVAGLAVRASDTGRVLMLQRALDPTDPASGMWEFPGGHMEGDERPMTAACREWQEETGCVLPFVPDVVAALAFGNGRSWTHGIYQGFVYDIPSETLLDLTSRDAVTNPDDPDGDMIEALAWWDPAQLVGNPAVRPELLDALGPVLQAIAACPCCEGSGEHGNGCECLHCDASGSQLGGSGPVPCEGALQGVADVTVTAEGVYESTCPCGTPVRYDEANGWEHADGSMGHDADLETVSDKMRRIAKAATGPKGDAPDGARWPGWHQDLKAVAYWKPLLINAMRDALDPHALAEQWLAQRTLAKAARRDPDQVANALAWLAAQDPQLIDALMIIHDMRVDGYVIGERTATAVLAGHSTVDWSGWTPGDPDAARLVTARGATNGLQDLLDDAGLTIRSVAATRMDRLANVLSDALARGDSADTLSVSISHLMTDPAWAERVAVTEIARAVSTATLNTYRANGVRQKMWLVSPDTRVCDRCVDNESAGELDLNDSFPSGDQLPPAHPSCRCALLPVTTS